MYRLARAIQGLSFRIDKLEKEYEIASLNETQTKFLRALEVAKNIVIHNRTFSGEIRLSNNLPDMTVNTFSLDRRKSINIEISYLE